jgi:glycerate-2-kinase
MFNFSCHSLQDSSAQRILSAAMGAADPSDAIRVAITLRADWIASARRVFLLSVGKAGIQMAEAALPFFDDKLAGGLVVAKHASHPTLDRVAVIEAGHPLPDARSLEAATRPRPALQVNAARLVDLSHFRGRLRTDGRAACRNFAGRSAKCHLDPFGGWRQH